MNRSDGGMVRLMTPMLDGESPDAAQARMMKLGSQASAVDITFRGNARIMLSPRATEDDLPHTLTRRQIAD